MSRRTHWLLAATAFLIILQMPGMVAADNCGSLSDCYRTAQAAIAATLGVGLFAALLSFGLDLIPIVGEIKGLIEAVTGHDMITGQELAWWERVLGVIPFAGEVVAAGVFVSRTARIAGEVAELERAAVRAEHLVELERGAERAERLGELERGASRELKVGSTEHKAQRWQDYQDRGGKYGYDRWSKQYDVNMENPTRGLGREKVYRDAVGGENRILETPHGNRQIDIYVPDKGYAGQLKTGKEYLTKENKWAIERDRYLVETSGLEVEWILEKGASKPLVEALEAAGIKVHIGPKLP